LKDGSAKNTGWYIKLQKKPLLSSVAGITMNNNKLAAAILTPCLRLPFSHPAGPKKKKAVKIKKI
jgi:hypothetical protein